MRNNSPFFHKSYLEMRRDWFIIAVPKLLSKKY